ncbi:helix-turn-helix domain-containing protein [Haladaptatus sp. NG-WS-4]
MREVLISVRHHGCPVSDTSAEHPNIHIQNLSKGRIANGRAKRLLCIRGSPSNIKKFATDFRSHSVVKRFDNITNISDTVAYFSSEIEYNNENPSILRLIHNEGCYQHNTVNVKRGREHWKIYTEGTGTIHKLIDKLEARNNDVSLYRSVDMDALKDSSSFDFATFLTDLTSKQQATFEAAISIGYYDETTKVTTDDVAASLGIHQSTAWEHLKKAENTILTTVGQQLFSESTMQTHDTEFNSAKQ